MKVMNNDCFLKKRFIISIDVIKCTNDKLSRVKSDKLNKQKTQHDNIY